MIAFFRKFTSKYFIYLLLCLLGFLAYGQTLKYPFVHDELFSIQNNPLITRFDWNEIIHGSGTAVGKWSAAINNVYYRPFLELFYRVEYAFFGFLPTGYHFFNIIFHVLNSILVYKLMGVFFRACQSELLLNDFRIDFNLKNIFAIIVSVLFLLHPVQTESVTCISGISNLLFAFFCLGSIYFYGLSSLQLDVKRYIASLLFCFLAFLTKEQAVMLPFLILWLDIILMPRKGSSLFQRRMAIGGYFFVLAGYFILRKFLMISGGMPSIPLNNELFLRIWSIPRTLFMYWGIIIFPRNLHYYRSIDVLDPVGSSAVALLAVMGGVVLIILRMPDPYRRLLMAGAGWFIISLLPVLNIVPIINEYSLILTAEHFIYLSLAGVLMFFIGIGCFWVERIKSTDKNICVGIIMGVLVISSLLATVRQNRVWAEEIPLFEKTVRFEPKLGRARMLLAGAYYKGQKYAMAATQYYQALNIMGRYMAVTTSLPAKAVYAEFVREIYFGLAGCFGALGEIQKSVELYSRTGMIDSPEAFAYNQSGVAFLKRQNFAEASVWFQRVLMFDENNLMAMNNLAVCYLLSGEKEKAKVILRNILRKDPESFFAKRNLRELSGSLK